MPKWQTGAHADVPQTAGPVFGMTDGSSVQWYNTTVTGTTSFGQLLSGALKSANLSTLRSVTAGAFAIDINGVTAQVGPINFNNVGSWPAAATLITAALTGATCEYTAPNLIITTTPAANGAISFARAPTTGTDVSGTLLLTQAGGAIVQ